MALTGLQIFKLLPKTNCKKCGMPTCLAFAMALAQKKTELDKCPDASEEAKNSLADASAPPMKLIKFGKGDAEVQIGQETVMFRHDEKFHNESIVAVSISDSLTGDALTQRIEAVNALKFERIGTKIQVNAVAVTNDSGDANTFASAAETIGSSCGLATILCSESADALTAALAKVADSVPLIGPATTDNAEQVAKIAAENKCPVIARSDSVEGLAELTEKINAGGTENIVLSLSGDLKSKLYGLSQLRNLALKKSFRPLGYPVISCVQEGTDDDQAVEAISLICKYSGIVVVETVAPHAVLPMLTAIMNIFTDPQKPVQVEPKLYAIGEVTKDSPLMFTTNFSLTYYTVESDVESSRVPSYILVVDTEGTSVLTAYSGDKLNEKTVADAMTKCNVESLLNHKKLVIPGYVAVMSGKLEEATGWEVLVGPRESSMLGKYLQEAI